MTDLEDAARQAAEALATLGSSVRQARESCGASSKAVSTADSRLAADRQALRTELDALGEALDDASEWLMTPGNKAELALIVLGRTFEESRADWTPLLDAEVEGLSELAGQSHQATEALEGWAEGAASHGEAAVARAGEIETALQQLVDDAEQSVGVALPAWLVKVADAVESGAEKAREVIATACLAPLERKQEEWDGRLEDVRGVLSKAFEDMKAHAEAMAGYSLDTAEGLVEEALGRRGGEVSAAEMELRELDAEVASMRGHLGQLVQDLIASLRGADEAVTATLEAWRDTVERWREVGYGR
jgi:hypothetical protein